MFSLSWSYYSLLLLGGDHELVHNLAATQSEAHHLFKQIEINSAQVSFLLVLRSVPVE